MADITQSFSQLLLTYGPGAMLDLPDSGRRCRAFRVGATAATGSRSPRSRLVPLLRQQLGDKLGARFRRASPAACVRRGTSRRPRPRRRGPPLSDLVHRGRASSARRERDR